MCRCPAEVRAAGLECWVSASYEDDHGDGFDTATWIAPDGTWVEGALTVRPAGTDDDWFVSRGSADRVYRAWFAEQDRGCCRFQVVDSSGVGIAAAAVRGELRFPAGRDGLFAFRVSPPIPSSTGRYQLRLLDGPLDDHGDSEATATPMVAGVPLSGSIELPGDRDVLAFDALKDGIYRLALSNRNSCPLQIRPGEPTVTAIDVSLAGMAPALLDFEPSADVRMFFELTGTGACTVELSSLGFDDHGDTQAEATVLATPSVSGRFELPDDVDVFQLTLNGGQTYSFSAAAGVFVVDVLIRIADGGGQAVAKGTGSIYLTPASTGRYFVQVQEAGPIWGSTPYTLTYQ